MSEQTEVQEEKNKFEDIFDGVFYEAVSSGTIYNIYIDLREKILRDSENKDNIESLDTAFKLSQRILKRIGGLEISEKLWKTYVEAIKSLIIIVYKMKENTYIAADLDKIKEQLMATIEDMIADLVIRASKCEDDS